MANPTWRDLLEAMVSDATDTWHSKANRLAAGGRFPTFYLYYRKSTTNEYGALYMIHEDETPDESWTIAAAEAFRADLTRDAARARIRAITWNLPILPEAANGQA